MEEIALIDIQAPSAAQGHGGNATVPLFSGKADFPAALLELLHEAIAEGEALEGEQPRQGVPGKRNSVEQRRPGEDDSAEKGSALLLQALVETTPQLPRANPEKAGRLILAGSEMIGGLTDHRRPETADPSAQPSGQEPAAPGSQPEASSREAPGESDAAALGAGDFDQTDVVKLRAEAEPFTPRRDVQPQSGARPPEQRRSGAAPMEEKLYHAAISKGGAAGLLEKANQRLDHSPVYQEPIPPSQEVSPGPLPAESAVRYLDISVESRGRSRPQREADALKDANFRQAQLPAATEPPLRAGSETEVNGADRQQKLFVPAQGRAGNSELPAATPLPDASSARNSETGLNHRDGPLAAAQHHLPVATDHPQGRPSNTEATAVDLLEKFQLIEQLVEQIKSASTLPGRDKNATIFLALKPEQAAGEIYIRAEARDNIISTAIYVRSDELKRSLEINLDLLQSALRAAGLGVDKLEVLSTRHLFSPSSSHGSSPGPQQEDRRHSNSRRVVAFAPSRESDESTFGRIEPDIAHKIRRLEEYA